MMVNNPNVSSLLALNRTVLDTNIALGIYNSYHVMYFETFHAWRSWGFDSKIMPIRLMLFTAWSCALNSLKECPSLEKVLWQGCNGCGRLRYGDKKKKKTQAEVTLVNLQGLRKQYGENKIPW